MSTRGWIVAVIGLLLVAGCTRQAPTKQAARSAALQANPCTPLPTCSDIQPSVIPQATVVQHVDLNASYSLPSSVDLQQDVTAGHRIIVGIRAGSHTNHGLSVRDTMGNVYTKAYEVDLAQHATTLAVFHAQVLRDGHDAVTISDNNIGATRYSVVEVSGVGLPARDGTTDEGFGALAATPSPGIPGEFVFTVISAESDVQFVAGSGGTALSSLGKMFTEHGAASATMDTTVAWGALAVAFLSDAVVGLPPCATPTPTFQWDKVVAAEGRGTGAIVGYAVYVNPTGGTPTKAFELRPELIDEATFMRGVDVSIPIQRYMSLTPLNEYEIRIKAIDDNGVESPEFSNVLTWCEPQLCAKPGPCS